MSRTALSIVALASLVTFLPHAAAAQSKAPAPAAAKPAAATVVNRNPASTTDLRSCRQPQWRNVRHETGPRG
jgi:hypothetical protein